MCELKFRAWDRKDKVMCLSTSHLESWFDKEKYEIMQYTGLHDKNGKEIYSKDFIKIPMETYKLFREVGFKPNKEQPIYLVDWFEELLGFGKVDINEIIRIQKQIKNIDIESIYQFVQPTYLWLIKKDLKVIGNVWENPELLKP